MPVSDPAVLRWLDIIVAQMVGYHSIVGIDSATNCQQLYLELDTVCHQLEPFPYHSMLSFIATPS